MTHSPKSNRPLRGFTLTELAVVLVIVAILVGGMLIPLAAQDQLRRADETQKTLMDARDALLGFAAANGRLPCPATAASNGLEAGVAGVCTLLDPLDVVPVGFVPAATLGLAPLDNQKRLIDAWGNPLRYAVTTSNSSAFTKPMTGVGFATLVPDLIVCPTALLGASAVQNAGTLTADCPIGVSSLTSKAVAVIYSLGQNAGGGGGGIDESNNPNPNVSSSTLASDRVFISHEPTPAASANGEFDDLVVWLSPNILFNRMIAAGRLP